MAFEPIAELRKFTASLLTPTIRSPIARKNKRNKIYKYRFSITHFCKSIIF
jgi:hypothetical protein